MPEVEQQSKLWMGAGESAPKKVKMVPSAGKVMATIFWNSYSVVPVDYLKKGRPIIKPNYPLLLDKLNVRHLAKKGELFCHNNAHNPRVDDSKLHDLLLEVLSHASYSPD